MKILKGWRVVKKTEKLEKGDRTEYVSHKTGRRIWKTIHPNYAGYPSDCFLDDAPFIRKKK